MPRPVEFGQDPDAELRPIEGGSGDEEVCDRIIVPSTCLPTKTLYPLVNQAPSIHLLEVGLERFRQLANLTFCRTLKKPEISEFFFLEC